MSSASAHLLRESFSIVICMNRAHLYPVLVGVERKSANIIDDPLDTFSAPQYLLTPARHSNLYDVGMQLSALGIDLESTSAPIPPFFVIDEAFCIIA